MRASDPSTYMKSKAIEMETYEEIQKQIDYNIGRRNEMLEHGGIGEMMTAVKFQDRIDGLIEKQKQL